MQLSPSISNVQDPHAPAASAIDAPNQRRLESRHEDARVAMTAVAGLAAQIRACSPHNGQ